MEKQNGMEGPLEICRCEPKICAEKCQSSTNAAEELEQAIRDQFYLMRNLTPQTRKCPHYVLLFSGLDEALYL